MVKLKLLDLRCIKHGEIGGDEPYIKVRSNKVWASDKMKSGMTVSLRSVAPISFKDEIEITLMEKDRFRDDCLGTGTATADQVGQGQQEFNFNEGDGEYQLIYEVIFA